MDDLPDPDDLRSFDIPGEPASCRTSARHLRRLAGGLEDAAGFLEHQDQGSPGLIGLSASAYRRRCGLLAAEAGDLARRCGLLAGGLDDLADALARAQDLTARAERLATGAGLVVGGLLVPPAGPPSWATGGDVAAWTAWSRARSRIRRARTIEVAARQAWRRLLLHHGSGHLGHDLPAAPHRTRVPTVPLDAGPGLLDPGGPTGAGPRAGSSDDPRHPPRAGHSAGPAGPGLDPVTCGLTPEPDGCCGTPDPLDRYVPASPRTGVDLPGVLGRRAGGVVGDRGEH